jgi:hypothetical protein
MSIDLPGLPRKNLPLRLSLDGLHNPDVKISMLHSMIPKLNWLQLFL